MDTAEQFKVGIIVTEVDYLAYFSSPENSPMMGIIINIFKDPKSPDNHSQKLVKVYWFNNRRYEVLPISLLRILSGGG